MKKNPYLSFSLAAGLAVSTSGAQASYEQPAEPPQQVLPFNVFATKAPTNKNKAKDGIVTLGANHDSVPGAPGANDDASVTAVTLELACVMKDLPTNMEMRFITFGAEELGLIGSRYYVSQLSEEEKDRFVGYFNMDMVGSRDASDLVINTPDGNENIVSRIKGSGFYLLILSRYHVMR
ncbi:hypothetical protein G3A_05690 [Bacillus sp. 17376]|nr:hypothetical protein G3A_05690 [Bacillus sp. 17376]